MHSDIEARVRNRGSERDERRCPPRDEGAENRRAGEAHRGVAGRERGRVRQSDERVIPVRPPLADCGLHSLGEPVRGRVGEQDENERLRAAA